jgi:hypothetical protein
MGKRGPKGREPGTLYATACQWVARFKSLREGASAGVQHDPDLRMCDDGTAKVEWVFTPYRGIRAEPETWDALLGAKTIEDVQTACQNSPWWLNPKYGGGPGSPYPSLPALASAFLKAKRNRRYPSSKRPTSEESRMWFLAIALAAETWGISLGRALNLFQTSSEFQKPGEPQIVKELIESTGNVTELIHPEGNYYTNGRTYWRRPNQSRKIKGVPSHDDSAS